MEEIKVGEYVRTKKKGIFKVLTITKTAYGYLCGTTDNEHISTFTIGKGGNTEIKNDIVKHSPNIIDLIEEGDFINNRCIAEIVYYDNYIDVAFVEDMDWYGFDNKELKGSSIVTKEQFNQVKYEV